MKYLMILFMVLAFSTQAKDEISTFHRMLMFNDSGQLLVVKIKGAGFWVTPGVYQTNSNTMQQALKDNAAEYGLAMTQSSLKGVFTIKSKIDNSTSIRNIFVTRTKDKVTKFPKYIESVKWLSVDEAVKTLSFPHISYFVEQVTKYPNQISGGTVIQTKDNDRYAAKIVDKFYPLF